MMTRPPLTVPAEPGPATPSLALPRLAMPHDPEVEAQILADQTEENRDD